MSDTIEDLGNYDITNVNGKIDEINLINFLENISTKTSDKNVYYSKVGNIYFIQGSLTFDTLTIDILPEIAVSDGFLLTNDNEILLIEKNNTTLTASTTGTKIVSGMYIADNGENRNG